MIQVDNEKCLRCGMCTGYDTEVFEFNDEGEIKVNNDKIDDKNIEAVKTAVDICPGTALSFIMDDRPIREGLKEIEKEDN